MIPIELLTKYHMVSLDEYKEFDGDTVDTERMFYETFLKQTDHIPLKIFENVIEELSTANLTSMLEVLFNFMKDVRVEYKDVLQYRKIAREKLNDLSIV